MPESREEARKRKLAQKPTESAFDKDDEQQARAAKRTPSKPAPTAAEKASTKGSVTRDFRGTEGVINDATGGNRLRSNQSTDDNQ